MIGATAAMAVPPQIAAPDDSRNATRWWTPRILPSIKKETKERVKNTPVFANTGVNINNIEEIFKIADGCVIGSSLKHEGITWNNIDPQRVKKFMDKVNQLRS